MASVTFAIPDEVKEDMKKLPWVNWSEIDKIDLLKKMKLKELSRKLESNLYLHRTGHKNLFSPARRILLHSWNHIRKIRFHSNCVFRPTAGSKYRYLPVFPSRRRKHYCWDRWSSRCCRTCFSGTTAYPNIRRLHKKFQSGILVWVWRWVWVRLVLAWGWEFWVLWADSSLCRICIRFRRRRHSHLKKKRFARRYKWRACIQTLPSRKWYMRPLHPGSVAD